jgi:FixJ family two-component response regulator
VFVHIVEDDEAVADALSMVLCELDYHPTVYRDGETFLAEAAVSAADVVILDLGLPGMSGTDVARRLSAQITPPRIIAISGKPKARIALQMRDFPGLTLLRKPLSIQALVNAVA